MSKQSKHGVVADPNFIKPTAQTPTVEKYVPVYTAEQLLIDGDKNTYLAFPTTLKLSDDTVLIAYKASTAHKDAKADLDMIVYNPATKQVVRKTTIDATAGEAAQDPELIRMPNGDLVIYLDVQRVTGNGQQRYGIKELRSVDNGVTWSVLSADGTYQSTTQVEKHGYRVLRDDRGITYGYAFDAVNVDGTVYMLAMSFPEFALDPGRSVHVIKSCDNGTTWTHVKNLTAMLGIAVNESTLTICDGGFIIHSRRDPDGGTRGVSFRTDREFNLLAREEYLNEEALIRTTHRPKLFVENGRYYLMGRNVLPDATSLGLYEIDPITLAPLNYVELKKLSDRGIGESFYAEYYLQQENGSSYFNVITYEDSRHKGHPDIVRYEYAWEELLSRGSAAPKAADDTDTKIREPIPFRTRTF